MIVQLSDDELLHDLSSVRAEKVTVTTMMQRSSGTGLRPFHGAVVVATVVVAAVIAFAALHFVVGIIWFVVKIAFVIAVLYGITRVVLRHAKA